MEKLDPNRPLFDPNHSTYHSIMVKQMGYDKAYREFLRATADNGVFSMKLLNKIRSYKPRNAAYRTVKWKPVSRLNDQSVL